MAWFSNCLRINAEVCTKIPRSVIASVGVERIFDDLFMLAKLTDSTDIDQMMGTFFSKKVKGRNFEQL